MNIVIFGPPGAGKGTQSNLIVKKFNLHQLSTGELLRKEIRDQTDLEKHISDESLKNRLIFDGYPRNLIQARNLENLLNKYDQKIDIALKLSVSLNTIKKRISERKTLEKRADDNENIAIKRYETYEKNIKPVIDFYKQSKLLKVVNGETLISEISDEISDIIKGIKG